MIPPGTEMPGTAAQDETMSGKSAHRRLPHNVLALSAVSLLTDVSSEMIYPLLPVFLVGTLGAGAAALGVIEGTAEATASFLKLGSGWVSDRVPRRKPLVVLGYGIATFARPLVAFAGSAAHVLAVRVSDRIGKGIRTSPRDALLADSVDPSIRGRAFGFHRAADHVGAVCGPLIAFALLTWFGVEMPTVFLLAAIPGLMALAVLVAFVREGPRAPASVAKVAPLPNASDGTPIGATSAPQIATSAAQPLGRTFWAFLSVLFVFTLGNCTDAFLLLRASQLGVPTAAIPLLWAGLHIVKAVSSTPAGALSDRVGRKPLLFVGWVWFAAVYFGLGAADEVWHVWALFLAYGVFFGLTEGTEKALVADLAPAARRGTAFGWFHLVVGVGTLPASILFGVLWDRIGSAGAFAVGASLALAAALLLAVVLPRSAKPSAAR